MRRIALIALVALTACKEEQAAAPPAPVDLTETALSYFCQMNVAEHGGPKGQIHLEGVRHDRQKPARPRRAAVVHGKILTPA